MRNGAAIRPDVGRRLESTERAQAFQTCASRERCLGQGAHRPTVHVERYQSRGTFDAVRVQRELRRVRIRMLLECGLASVRDAARSRVGTFRMLFVLRLVQWPLRACLRALLRRFPRDPSLLAFGADGNRFADNAAYLFLHMSQSRDLRCVWVTGSRTVARALRERDLDAVHRWSARGVWVAIRASWYVFSSYRSDVNLWLGDGARTLNLWHGLGVKRIQRDRVAGAGATVYAAPDGSLTARVFADDRHRPDFVLSGSDGTSSVLSSAFGVPRSRCLPFGYPRNDHLAAGMDPPDPLVDPQLYARLRARTVVGYFPTFRDDSVSLPGGVPTVTRLAEIVAEQDAVLMFKAHQASVVPVEGSESLVVLASDADLNAYLGVCNVLVTDYSSVASDYLLLGRPIVLFCPDLDEYEATRGFALDPYQFLPGIVTRTSDELYDILSDITKIPLSPTHTASLVFYWGEHPPAGACERIARFLTAHSGGHQTVMAEGPLKP